METAKSPLSWGTGHADIIAVQEMLKDAGFKVKEIDMEAYMECRTKIQKMLDDFLGYYCPTLNRFDNSLLVKPGLPGGMMGSLMTDLEDNLKSLNKWKVKNNQAELTTDQLLVKLFDEVAYVWPKLGYPTLVTPFSQYVKNLAIMNVMQIERGKQRWTMIADTVWDMILGKAGALPGEVDPLLVELAKKEGYEFVKNDPQENYPDCLDDYRYKMKENGWDTGLDDEVLFEYAKRPTQYEAYKSGKAKAEFESDLARRRLEKDGAAAASKPENIIVTVNGQNYKVHISYDGQVDEAAMNAQLNEQPMMEGGTELVAPLEGKFFLVNGTAETPKKVGDKVNAGEVVCYIEAMKTYNAIKAEVSGTITAINYNPGDSVSEDDVLMFIA